MGRHRLPGFCDDYWGCRKLKAHTQSACATAESTLNQHATATFYFVTRGAVATQADAAAIERQLLERGYGFRGCQFRRDGEVNTVYAIRRQTKQARQSIRAAIRKDNPAARVIVTGYYAQRAPRNLLRWTEFPGVVSNSHKPKFRAHW